MATNPSAARDSDKSVEAILSGSVESLSSAECVVEFSRRLDLNVVGKVECIVEEKLTAGDPNRAEAILLATERAAQIAGTDAIRYWARIGRGMLAAMRENFERAGTLYEEGFEHLDALDELNGRALLRAYTVAGDWLCDRALREKKVSEAREILARMLQRARAANEDALEVNIIVKFLWLAQSINDLDSEEAHALRLIEGSFLRKAAALKETLIALLEKAASDLYAAGDSKYETARRIARGVVDEAPTGGLFLILATTAFTLEDFGDALVWLDRLLEAPEKLLPGYDVNVLYHRRALCLVHLNRNQEADESIQRAIQLKPEDPYLRFGAAQVFEQTGDHERTIEEYAETIRLAEARLANAVPAAQTRDQKRSLKEYLSSTPVEDLRDFAIVRHALCLRRIGRNSEAVADLEMLASQGDEISRAKALMMLADWAQKEGRLNDAAELLGRARSLNSRQADEIELQLGSVLIGLGSYDDALNVLVPLCHKSRKPEQCVQLLDKIPQSWTNYSRIEKWRGYAKTEAGWPREGLVDLDAAVAADPSDGDALYLRALARITYGVQPGQEDWNGSRSMKHIRESLDDLYGAVMLSPDNTEARRVIKWLVERAAANAEMNEFFSVGGNRDGDLFKVFPELNAAFQKAWDANTLGYKRQWDECVLAWSETMSLYESGGFEIMACRTNIRLADAYLRLLDFDKVEEHLERADQLRFLVGVPLSREVLDRYNDMVSKRGAYERPTLGEEIEYVWIYGHAGYDYLTLIFLKANYRHRLGDLVGALEYADELKPILDDLPTYLGFIFGIDEVLWVVSIFRDGGRYDDALHLLDLLQTHATETNRSFDVLYSRGLIHDVKGQSLLARDAYERALAVIEGISRPVGIGPYVQYAASLLHTGREADAHHVLQGIDIDHASVSDRDRLFYDIVAASVDEARGAYAEGLNLVEKAVSIVEERRAEIQDPAGRRAWQGHQANLFSVAVKLYAVTGQTQKAWRAVELSKARTLLDELYGRAALSPQHASLVDDLETIERATKIAEQEINRDTTDDVVATLRTEAVAELLQLLEPKFHDVLISSSFSNRDFPAIRDALIERKGDLLNKEQRIRDMASTPAGTVMAFDELTDLLKEE